MRNLTSPFLLAPWLFQPAGKCGPLAEAGTADFTAVATGLAAVAKVVVAAGTGPVIETTGADRFVFTAGTGTVIAAAADRSVFAAGSGTAMAGENFTVFKGRVVIV